MMSSLIPMLVISLSVGIAAWLVFMWAVKSGQFDDMEGPKHRMLDDDDEHYIAHGPDMDKDKDKKGEKREDRDEDGN